MSKIPEPAMCASEAPVVIEAYSRGPHGGLYGSLDESHYVCERHVDVAEKRIREAGMTPFRAQRPVAGRTCGHVFDYTDIGGNKALLTVRPIPAAVQPDEPVEDDEVDTDPEVPMPAPASWTCPYCPFVASESNVEAALAHVADHEAGRAVAMTDAQLTAAYDEGAAPLPRRPVLADVPPAPSVPLGDDTTGAEAETYLAAIQATEDGVA